MTDVIDSAESNLNQKLTAEQIEKECPARLQQIGKEIRQRIAKAERQAELAQNHLIAVDQLLAEAKTMCDEGGFEKFRESFCPQLGKSQAYALLAIAAGKKTLAEHRADERERKRRTRANQKALESLSGTVPENRESPLELQDATTGVGEVEATTNLADKPPAEPRSRVQSKDEALFGFTDTCHGTRPQDQRDKS